MADFLIIGATRAHAKGTHFFAFEDENLNCKGPGTGYINNSTTDLAEYQAPFADAPRKAGNRYSPVPSFRITQNSQRRIVRYLTTILVHGSVNIQHLCRGIFPDQRPQNGLRWRHTDATPLRTN